MDDSLEKFLHTCTTAALEAAYKGGEVLLEHWGRISSYQTKEGPSDLVTIADKESERIIVGHLQGIFPDHGFIAEESGGSGISKSKYTWVIDPLDGTTNYTHQYPMVSVSIALLEEGVPVVGVVYSPIMKEEFIGRKGKGAKLNGEPIHVSPIIQLSESLMSTGFAYDRRSTKNNNYAEFCHFTNECQGVRRSGSAALDLAYLAAGRFDGFWERGLKSWDVAAGGLLVQEAGGTVTGYDGSPWDIHSGRILASNGHLHKRISMELMKFQNRKE